MSEQNGFMGKLQNVILPIGTFLTNEKHFASISAGLQASVGISIIAAFVQIAKTVIGMFAEGGVLANALGFSFSWAVSAQAVLTVPYDMTMGLLAVIVAFAIAFNLAKYYKMNQLSTGIVAMLMFIMVVAPIQTVTLADGTSTFTGLNSTWLGAPGLFTAILLSLASVEISYFAIKRNWVVRMPDVVPQFLQDSFTSMIPLLLNTLVLYGINAILKLTIGLDIPSVIFAVFAVPVSMILGSVPGMFVVIIFALLLWTVGVHGTMIVYPFLIPIMIGAITTNAELVAQGQAPVFNAAFLFSAAALAGGTGNTLGLALLSKYKAKSEQLKAIGNVSWLPGIFGVNEPVIFGMPIAFNPILAIPFILQGLIIAVLLWIGYSIGFLSPSYILIMSLMPIGVGEFLGTLSWKNALFSWLMVPVTALIYYPFFKAYDAQLVAKEAAQKQ